MRPKNKYILSLFIFLSIILSYNVKVNGEDIYNDDLSSYESVESNFLNNQYSTIYFSKLGNHGYMTEAGLEVIKFFKSLGYNKIKIDEIIENIGSNKVIQKLGGKLINQKEEYFENEKTKIYH